MIGGIFLRNRRYSTSDERLREVNVTKDSNRDLSDAFDHSRIANFSDDAVGVLGWKGTGLLLITLLLGFGIFKQFFN